MNEKLLNMTPMERQKWLIDEFNQFKSIGVTHLPDGLLFFDKYALRWYIDGMNAYITLETEDELLLVHQLSLETGTVIIRKDVGYSEGRKNVRNIMSDLEPWLYGLDSPFSYIVPYTHLEIRDEKPKYISMEDVIKKLVKRISDSMDDEEDPA